MNNGQVTFTGSNADEVAATLGLYVYPHPTQAAIVLFATAAAVDPLGTAAAGQTITVTSGNTVKVTGVPTGTQLPPPSGPSNGGPIYPTLAQVQALIAAGGGQVDLTPYLPKTDAASTYVTVVEHGVTAGTARPAGAKRVYWLGSVAPTNAVANDRWIDTSDAVIVERIFTGGVWRALSVDGGNLPTRVASLTPATTSAAPTVQRLNLYAPATSDLTPPLPLANSVPNGTVIGFKNATGTALVTPTCSGSDHIGSTTGSTAIPVRTLDQITWLASDGNSVWTKVDGELSLPAMDARFLFKPAQYGLASKFASWAPYTYDAREFATSANPLVNSDGSPGNLTVVWDAFKTAMAGATKPRRLFLPDGNYQATKAATQNAQASAPHGLYAASLLGIIGESRGTVIQASSDATPLHWALGSGQLVDVEIGNLTIDCSAQTNASYTTQLKALFMQDMLRPHFHDLTLIGAWSTALGCDYLQDYLIERLLILNPGRQISALAIANPEAYSGCSGVGIGTGKYQTEAGIVSDLIVKGAGRIGLFYEIQAGQSFYSRGHVARGIEAIGCWAGLQDCGADGLDADIVATDGTYGVLHDRSILAAKTGVNGRVRLHGERNTLADVALGNCPDGNYEFVGVGRSTYRSAPSPNANVGPKVVVDLTPDQTKAITVGADKYVDNFTAADGTTLSGRTAPDGTSTAAWTADLTLQVAGNAIKATSGSATVIGTIDTGAADGKLKFTVTARNASDTGIIGGGVIRYTDANNYIQVGLRQNASTKGYAVIARVGGASQNIAFSTQAPVAGDVVECVFQGTQFVLYVNGTKIASGNANTSGKGNGLQANTKHGLFGNFSDPTTALDSWGFNLSPYRMAP